MAGRDPHERANGWDRDAAIDLIERAHAAGRIGSADRTIRKNNVATASTVGELEMITRDLVADLAAPAAYAEAVPTEPVVPQPAEPAVQDLGAPAFERPPTDETGTPVGEPPPAASAPPTLQVPPEVMTRSYVVRRRSGAPGLLFFALALSVAGVALSVFLTTAGLPDFEGGDPETVEVDDPYTFDADGMRWMVGRYRSEFGTTTAMRTVFYDGYVTFDVPAEDGSATTQGWIYRNGTFSEMSTPRATAAGEVAVNLLKVDYDELGRTLAKARRTLGVPDGRVTHVIVADDPFEGKASISVYVSNDVAQHGFLKTDLRGKLLRSFPAAG